MTAEEAAERERLGLRRVVSDDDDDAIVDELVQQDVRRYARSDAPDDGRPGFRIAGAEYNAFWSADPTSPKLSLRTSQIVDPPDGQMPSLTRDALEGWEAREAARSTRSQADDWEDRGLSERCITRNGLPGEMLGSSQQPLKEIVQTPGYVTIVMPYGYVRIIPLADDADDHPPLGAAIRQWNGDARGRWDGDTLVVETMNFKNTVKNVVPAHGGPFGGSAHVHYYPGTGEDAPSDGALHADRPGDTRSIATRWQTRRCLSGPGAPSTISRSIRGALTAIRTDSSNTRAMNTTTAW